MENPTPASTSRIFHWKYAPNTGRQADIIISPNIWTLLRRNLKKIGPPSLTTCKRTRSIGQRTRPRQRRAATISLIAPSLSCVAANCVLASSTPSHVTKLHHIIITDGSNGSTHNNTSSLVTLDSETHQSPVATENNSHTFNINTICETLSAQSPIIKPVLLSTAVIELVDKHNNYVQARALLDSGSQRCFITKALCDQLNASIIQSTHTIKGVGNAVTQSTQTCDITIRSLSSSYTADIKCLVLQTISSDLPSTSISIQEHNFKIPDNIQLADPKYFMSQPIDMLIGADYFWDLLEEGKIRLANGPFLQNTKLGWIISGPIYNSTHHDSQVHCNFTEAIDTQLRKFWEIEDLPGFIDARSDDEKACEEHFIKTTTRDEQGRFCVQIPFKESPDKLGDTFTQAERRFHALEKRLSHTPLHKEMYTQFIKEYVELGHMSQVDTYTTPHYILPHHGVYRAHSETTRLRVVFDASMPSTTGKSLNDIQRVGPAIQGDLFSILLRFRQHKYVACADVEKMYRQVLIDPSQRDLQLILWRDNPSDKLDVYSLKTITYGMSASPFLAVRCLKELAAESNNPEISRTIRDDFYVDDLITGADSIDKLTHICDETARILNSACFPLRKWIFNFSRETKVDQPYASKELSMDENVHHKTLGLAWSNESDTLHFSTEFKKEEKKLTKRIILSSISKIFDPLGLLSPLITSAKILLQRLWLLGNIGWDDALPCDVVNSWEQFIFSLNMLGQLKIPRYAFSTDGTRTELHIFTDASQVAYGASAFIRIICSDTSVIVKLLCSKGRVAPIKPISIPRLELNGAVMGARLYVKVKEALLCKFDSVTFWTDSTIVIGWLRMNPNQLKTFVQNRTAEIHELTSGLSWQHIAGKHNPADLVSRGATLDTLLKNQLWWAGPSFLNDPSFDTSAVKSLEVVESASQDLPEIKSQTTQSYHASDNNNWFPFERYSQFNRMKRSFAYLMRFIHNTRNKNNKRTGALSVEELNESLTKLTKISQQESFPSVYETLSKQETLKNSHNLSKLHPFLDENHIIRVGGRLLNSADYSYDKKHPILTSGKHHFTTLLFRDEHLRQLHAAPQALLYTLRETWWPVRGRDAARRTVHRCARCARLRAKPLTPLMGNLPSERISPGFAFINTGVDYMGPVYILNRKGRGAQTVKAYVCIFVCMATRAVNLELVGDLSTEAYLLALKRHISRYSKPNTIFSDNGRNFVGLMNDFTKFLGKCSSEIIDYATSQNIKFSFIPPFSPNFGGLWEAGVKSCKYHLRRVIGNSHLTYEEFNTVLAQIQAVLNSRPLSPLSSDPHDYYPLSPAHFLVGRPLTAPLCEDVSNTACNRLTRYRRVEQIRQHFWSRWSKEYISEMQTRTKWKSRLDDLKPDTLVLIKDDQLPPLKWHLGRIITTVPGRDGISRVADIRTEKGVIRRACSKICPLWEEDD
ncbi:unnamed protein product [Plutella xylostella]|nr:unnamed protein product [Plutella xylostella]